MAGTDDQSKQPDGGMEMADGSVIDGKTGKVIQPAPQVIPAVFTPESDPKALVASTPAAATPPATDPKPAAAADDKKPEEPTSKSSYTGTFRKDGHIFSASNGDVTTDLGPEGQAGGGTGNMPYVDAKTHKLMSADGKTTLGDEPRPHVESKPAEAAPAATGKGQKHGGAEKKHAPGDAPKSGVDATSLADMKKYIKTSRDVIKELDKNRHVEGMPPLSKEEEDQFKAARTALDKAEKALTGKHMTKQQRLDTFDASKEVMQKFTTAETDIITKAKADAKAEPETVDLGAPRTAAADDKLKGLTDDQKKEFRANEAKLLDVDKSAREALTKAASGEKPLKDEEKKALADILQADDKLIDKVQADPQQGIGDAFKENSKELADKSKAYAKVTDDKSENNPFIAIITALLKMFGIDTAALGLPGAGNDPAAQAQPDQAGGKGGPPTIAMSPKDAVDAIHAQGAHEAKIQEQINNARNEGRQEGGYYMNQPGGGGMQGSYFAQGGGRYIMAGGMPYGSQFAGPMYVGDPYMYGGGSSVSLSIGGGGGHGGGLGLPDPLGVFSHDGLLGGVLPDPGRVFSGSSPGGALDHRLGPDRHGGGNAPAPVQHAPAAPVAHTASPLVQSTFAPRTFTQPHPPAAFAARTFQQMHAAPARIAMARPGLGRHL
jgi:hypothetical protein